MQKFLSDKNMAIIPHPSFLPYFVKYDLFEFLGTELWLLVAIRSLFLEHP